MISQERKKKRGKKNPAISELSLTFLLALPPYYIYVLKLAWSQKLFVAF